MILLLGGTSETAPLATALAGAGYDVLVSTATNAALDIGTHARIRRRSGKLDLHAMIALARDEHVRAIVDATHPYAVQAHATASEAAQALRIPCFTYTRPSGIAQTPSVHNPSRDREGAEGPLADARGSDNCAAGETPAVHIAATHDEAARLACEAGGPVLLTTGSRNLAPYVSAARGRGVTLIVRVLPEAESLAACRAAGIPDDHIVAARGPFGVEENRALIRRSGIRTLVTKDSGAAGGFAEKLEAAALERCRVVVVRRPEAFGRDVFSDIHSLVEALAARCPP